MSAITKALRKMRAEGMAVQSDSAQRRAVQDPPISAATRKGIPLGEEMRSSSGSSGLGGARPTEQIVLAANHTNKMIMMLLGVIVVGLVSLGVGFVAMDFARRSNRLQPVQTGAPDVIYIRNGPGVAKVISQTPVRATPVVQPTADAQPQPGAEGMIIEATAPPRVSATPAEQDVPPMVPDEEAIPEPLLTPKAKARKMHIEGIFWDRKRPMALIDGKIVELNGEVGGAEVVDISPTSITYLIDGEKIKINQ